MTGAITPRAPWLIAIAFGIALALLASWHAAGAGTGAPQAASVAIAPLGAAEHHAGCPLLAERAQPVLAQAPKAPALKSGNAANRSRHAWHDLALALATRAGPAPAAPPAPSRPLYLLSSRLRR